MLRQALQDCIDRLESQTVALASTCSETLHEAVNCLQTGNLQVAREIIEADKEINKARKNIEEQCVSLIATQQPVSLDLRELIAIIHMSTDLERFADYAKGIASIMTRMKTVPDAFDLTLLFKMEAHTRMMLTEVMEAFVDRDVARAQKTCDLDDAVDDWDIEFFRHALEVVSKHPELFLQATYLKWIAHSLERAADHVTNLAEHTISLH